MGQHYACGHAARSRVKTVTHLQKSLESRVNKKIRTRAPTQMMVTLTILVKIFFHLGAMTGRATVRVIVLIPGPITIAAAAPARKQLPRSAPTATPLTRTVA